MDRLGSLLVHEPGDGWRSVGLRGAARAVVSTRTGFDHETHIADSDESGVAVALSGELYGDRSGKAAAAAVKSSYIEQGDRCVDELDGSFVLMVRDERAGRTLIASDPSGSRPVFYASLGDWLIVAPEQSMIAVTLASVGAGFPALQEGASVTFLLHGHLLGDQTWFEGVHALAPGCTVGVQADGATVVRRYFEAGPTTGQRLDLPEPELHDQLARRLRAAVEKRWHDTRDVVLPLSGGIDSRAILGCLLERGRAPLRTVSWGVDESTVGSDAFVARALSETYGTEHEFLQRRSTQLPEELDEMTLRVCGLTDDPAMHHHELNLMRRIRRELDGSHLLRGDECFGFGGVAASDDEAFARVGITCLSLRPDVRALVARSDVAAETERSDQMLADLAEECPVSDFTDRKDYYYATQRLPQYLNRSSYYKMSVLSLQNPWLDRDVLDFVWSVPTRHRVEKALFLSTLDHMFPGLMRQPKATTHSLENWAGTVARDERLAGFIRSRLVDGVDRFGPGLSPSGVVAAVEAVLSPGRPPESSSFRDRAAGTVRRLLPAPVFSRVKTRFIRQALRRPLPPGTLVMRLLVLQSWLGQVDDLRRQASASAHKLQAPQGGTVMQERETI